VTSVLYPGLIAFGCAVVLDASLRLPSLLHPVAWYGRLAALLIRRAPLQGPARAGGVGLVLALALPIIAGLFAARGLTLSARLSPWIAGALQVLLLYSCVCLYGLLDAVAQLRAALRDQGLPAARERLRWLCSRDPSQLDEAELVNGALESLAENLSDSVVAPLLFLACFGLPAAVAYRAINTLDAMIGYRGRYEWLGKATARLDDVVNWLPARLTALLLMAAGASLPRRWQVSARRGFATWRRDHAQTPSPNGGHPMAATAGLLGVCLDKPGCYALGAELPRPALPDLERGLRLCRRAGWFALAATALVLSIRGGALG
jgi:adenosylcobinamide-phosphate synthase